MIGLILAIIVFNLIAFKKCKRLSKNQIAHIWFYTIACQNLFDIYVDFKYHGYWYFTKAIDWSGLPAHILLLPPVNMIFLNWYPLTSNLKTKGIYLVLFVISILIYEMIAMLPQPFGYFHYGWWDWKYSAILDPILLISLLKYYKWICRIE
ncbi:hypothetical protein [Heyndrickxia acidicola]|uniref:Uncharacterized protein n=1 Tax=Heyndrickxia acidicola TaxID=209389 RepID=A0ABU6MKU0_9BACI|nr:hypothetical protein [Heyndrickxia acidicola]MED1205309.1 hypothetical protein [Heyndrickxia acidicola]